MKQLFASLASALFCRWPTPLLLSMSVVLVTACSDKPPENSPAGQPSSGAVERPSIDSSLPPDIVSNVDTEYLLEEGSTADLPPTTVVNQDIDLIQFPPDSDNDDQPGLIITGLRDRDPDYLTSPWLVNTGVFRLASKTPGTGDGYVDLVQYRNDFPLTAHMRFFAPLLDSCRVHSADSAVSIEQENESPPLSIPGGESVVINTPAGPWFNYSREYENGEALYSANNSLPGVLPEFAMLSIPGGMFPTVAAHSLFEPAAVERLKPEKEISVTAESKYAWIPDNPSGYVKINLLAYDASDNFLGFAVTCWVEDDGAFTMPDKVLSFVASSQPGLRLVARYSRVYARLDLVNGIVIYQNNEVAE